MLLHHTIMHPGKKAKAIALDFGVGQHISRCRAISVCPNQTCLGPCTHTCRRRHMEHHTCLGVKSCRAMLSLSLKSKGHHVVQGTGKEDTPSVPNKCLISILRDVLIDIFVKALDIKNKILRLRCLNIQHYVRRSFTSLCCAQWTINMFELIELIGPKWPKCIQRIHMSRGKVLAACASANHCLSHRRRIKI